MLCNESLFNSSKIEIMNYLSSLHQTLSVEDVSNSNLPGLPSKRADWAHSEGMRWHHVSPRPFHSRTPIPTTVALPTQSRTINHADSRTTDSRFDSYYALICTYKSYTAYGFRFLSVSVDEFPSQEKQSLQSSFFLTRRDCKLPSWETPLVE